MKKISVIVQAGDDESAVARLRSLGLLHVEHQQEPRGRQLAVLREDIALLDGAITVLEGMRTERRECGGAAKPVVDWAATARHIADLRKRYDQLLDYSFTLRSAIETWKPWGDFDPEEIRELAGEGILVRLFEVPAKEIGTFPAGLAVVQIARRKGTVLCAAASRGSRPVPFPEIVLPHMSLRRMRERAAEDAKTMASIRDQLCAHVVHCDHLARIRTSVKAELAFQEALRGMGRQEELAYIRGYVPADQAAVLEQAAQRERWGIVIEDPGDEDTIPTLVRTSRMVSTIAPVFRLLDVVPGYRELDVSRHVLIFFSVFFGILIGDAGYGLMYALLSFVIVRRSARAGTASDVPRLLFLLSSCAIVWGVLTGTFFGQAWLSGFGVKPLLPALNDARNMQAFCFFLGALHLSLAHAWRAVIKAPSPAALADVGWIGILWAAFFMARSLVLSYPFPAAGTWLLAAGAALVLFFSSPHKNVFKSFGEGLGILALNLMNNFTDVVSYIRLFAVGLAGVAVADAFNGMAAGVGFGSAVNICLSLVIIIAGHLLGVILGPISVLVHGVRLNVLEFSGHAGITWSGVAYKPLKKE